MPFQADGNSHTLDVLYSAATNKQFITVQSKNGNTFYLVIDYDKPIDEEAEIYETHFLNLVDERDLLALMSDEEKEEGPGPDRAACRGTAEEESGKRHDRPGRSSGFGRDCRLRFPEEQGERKCSAKGY